MAMKGVVEKREEIVEMKRAAEGADVVKCKEKVSWNVAEGERGSCSRNVGSWPFV